MKRLLPAFLLIFLSTTAFAVSEPVGKVTVDPNTPEASASVDLEAGTGFWTADKRLSQKITLSARHITVANLLSTLSGMSGVTLNAGYNSKDWQVRDRKMNIFVKDLPLADMLRSVGRVMKFKWSRTQAGDTFTYRLYMDRKAIIEAEGESYRAEERFNAERKRKREKFVNDIGELANASDEELAKLRDEDPMMYAMSAIGLAGPLHDLFENKPEACNAFLEGTNFALSSDSDSISESLRESLIGIGTAINKTDIDGSSRPSAEDIAANNYSVRIAIDAPDNNSGSNFDELFSRFTLAGISCMVEKRNPDGSVSAVDGEFELPICDPSSSIGKGLAKLVIDRMEAGPNAEKPTGFSVSLDPDELRKSDFGEPIAEHKDYPELSITVNFPKNADALKTLEDKFALLAETTGLNVISDCFNKPSFSSFSGEVPVQKLLESMALVDSYNWWLQGNIIEMRDRYWFRKRSLQIPESYLQKWRENMKANGILDIDDLADMAALMRGKEQYEANIAGDDILDNGSMQLTYQLSLPFLKFYSTLDKNQRAALYSDAGLDLATLSLDQKEAVKTILNWWNGKSQLVVKGKKQKYEQKQFAYSFDTSNGYSVGWVRTPALEDKKPKSGGESPGK